MTGNRARYPSGFPDHAQAKVEAAKIRATQAFEQAKQRIRRPTDFYSMGSDGFKVRELLTDWIMAVFSVFADEACALGRDNTWKVVLLHREVSDFLVMLTREAYEEKGFDLLGERLPEMVVLNFNRFVLLPGIDQEFRARKEWKKYEQDRLAVAELQAGKTHRLSFNATMGGFRTVEVPPSESEERPAEDIQPTVEPKHKRLPRTITSTAAMQRIESYLTNSPGGPRKLFEDAQISERTLRTVRRSGKAERATFAQIAKAMGISIEDLLNSQTGQDGGKITEK